jgi:succinyl-CoA synthetase beta subunit
MVIRLTGTNEDIAMRILAAEGLTAMTSMDDAVQRAVALAQERAEGAA